MDQPTSNAIHCQCGYDRTGLDTDALCPECGQLDTKQTTKKSLSEAWRTSTTRRGKSGFVLAVMTLVVGLANSALAIYMMIWLSSPGYKGSTAGLILIYPPLIWGVLQLPLGGLALSACMPHKSLPRNEAELRRYSLIFTAWGLAIPFLVILVVCGGVAS
ncbi:MAG: hypothetical protein MK089_09280 [Phycisphaerales bacterium]|nr:hypothetical protein [Phycisphaerales bacterium]